MSRGQTWSTEDVHLGRASVFLENASLFKMPVVNAHWNDFLHWIEINRNNTVEIVSSGASGAKCQHILT